MRKLLNLKAARRLLTVLTVSAIVISLFCMSSTLPATAATVTPKQTLTDRGVATALDPNNFKHTNATVETMGEEGAYTDANGDGTVLHFTFTASNQSKSSSSFVLGGLDPAKTYRVSFYAKGEALGLSGNLWVNYYDEDGNIVKNDADKTIATNASLSAGKLYSDWTAISATITPYSSNILVGFWIKNGTNATTNNLYVDQIVVEEAYNTYQTSTTTTYNATVGQIKNSALNWRDDAKLTTELVTGGVDGNNECIEITNHRAGSQGTNVTMYGYDPAKKYTISFWIKNTKRLGWNTSFSAVAATNIQSYWQYTVHSDWTQYTIPDITPGDGGKIQFAFWVQNGGFAEDTEASFYIDAITIYESASVDVSGATIATTTDENKQDLRFMAEMNGYVPATATNVEYGVYMVRTSKLAELGGELNEELYQANQGVVIKASETVASAADLPTTIHANLKNAVNNAVRCNVEISMRAYVKYTVYGGNTYYDKTGAPVDDSALKTVYTYSDNTSTEGSVVTNGVASRSVYGVAYSIVNTQLAAGASGLTYVESTGKFTVDATGAEATDAEVLAFALENINYLG